MSGKSASPFDTAVVPSIAGRPKIVLVGGTGRVGSSTASNLLRTIPEAEIVLGSRTRETFENALLRRPELD